MNIKKSWPATKVGSGHQGGHHDEHSKPRWCAYQGPYPEPKAEKPNLYYASLLMDDMAGAVSELTATTQYLYHHQVLYDRYPDVAELLECASIVEMTHLELLAETIIHLGGQPKFGVMTNCGMEWWRGDLVYYGCDICDMLSADVEAERQAIINYKRHIEMIDDKYVKALLNRILLDEQHHLEEFKAKRQKYCYSQR